jgi:hypothetical protein
MDKTEEFIQHWGILGMKWGVRKRMDGSIAPRSTLGILARIDQGWAERATKREYTRVYRKAKRRIRMGIREINRDPKFKGKNFMKDSPLRREYYAAYSKMVTNQLNSAVGRVSLLNPLTKIGTSPIRTMELHFDFDVNQRPQATIRRTETMFGLKAPNKLARATRRVESRTEYHFKKAVNAIKSLKHADDPDALPVELIYDEMGYIIDLVVQEEDMEQAMEDETNDFLQHWGIMGMRWGVRKGDSSGGTSTDIGSTKKKLKSNQVELLSDEALKTRVARIKLEQEYATLTAPKKTLGKRFVENVLLKGVETIALSIFIKEGTKFGSKLVGDIFDRHSATESVVNDHKAKSGFSDFFKSMASTPFAASSNYTHSDFVNARAQKPYDYNPVTTILLPGDSRRFKQIGMK